MILKLKTLIFLSIVLPTNFSHAIGNEAGGGGRDVELEFAEIAYSFTDILTKHRIELPDFMDFDLNAFLAAQANTEVYAVDTLCTNTQDEAPGSAGVRCLDAEYLPDRKQIRFSTETWKRKNCIRKMGIVVHELGRAAGLENGNYRYSARVSRNDLLRTFCARYDYEMEMQTKK